MPRFARRRWMAGLRALNGQWRMLALADAARGGVACAVPALLAALCQQPLLCWSAIAAFWTCLADEPELDRAVRARKGLVFGLLGGLASGIAIASRAVPLLPPLLAATVVWLCALERRRGPAAGMRGLLVATSFAISAVFSVQGWAAGAQYFAYFLAAAHGRPLARPCCGRLVRHHVPFAQAPGILPVPPGLHAASPRAR